MSEATERSSHTVTAANSRELLEELLNELSENPDKAREIELRIHDAFLQSKAIMVLDMSGFSRTTMDHGIVTFLLMIHHMHFLALPVIEQHGGHVVKEEADNLFCLFDTVDAAVEASRAIARSLDTANLILPKSRELYVSFGIGYGEILNIADEDIWGQEVNAASKLGEDVAKLGEILLTEAAFQHLTLTDIPHHKESSTISAMEFDYFALDH